MDKDEKYLFVSNRGDDSVAMFRVGADAQLTLTDVRKTGGSWPRDIDIFGDIIIIANQNSDNITSLRIDSGSERLQAAPFTLNTVKPICIMKEV